MLYRYRGLGMASIIVIALIGILTGSLYASKDYKPLNVTVTGRGINQYNDSVRWVVPGIGPFGQIPIWMPPDNKLPKTPEEHARYRDELAKGLTDRIEKLSDKAGGRFEVQLISNINTAGYLNPFALGRHAVVEAWESDVYQALDMTKVSLQKRSPEFKAIVASNDGYLFSRIIPMLSHNPIDAAVMIDPRAWLSDVVATYRTMRGRLSLISDSGDAWANPLADHSPNMPESIGAKLRVTVSPYAGAYATWDKAEGMVANRHHAESLKQYCPNMNIYYVDTGQVSNILNKFRSHVWTASPNNAIKSAKTSDGKDLNIGTSYGVILRAFGDQKGSSKLSDDTDLGGIDLSNLRLSYISAKPQAKGANAGRLFSSVYLGGKADVTKLKQAAGISMDSFLIGLAVPAAKFWVNLNPTEPDRIADPDLSRTDVARVLLEADLRMKKDAAKITDPRLSEVGREYWRRVVDAAGGSSGSLHVTQQTRFWIVPGDIEVAGDGDDLYLIRSDLEVRLESEYFSAKGVKAGSAHQASIASEQVSKELVLPYLTDAVNHAPQYADLRRVYQGLIMATWYRQHHTGSNAPYADRIDSGDLSGLDSRTVWSPRAIWHRYVVSVQKGEYNFAETRKETQGNTIVTHITQYFSGGVDFTDIQLPPVQPLAPEMAALIAKAVATPEGVQRGQIVWFSNVESFCSCGSPTMLDCAPLEPARMSTEGAAASSGLWRIAGVIVVGIVLIVSGIWACWRSRETQS